MKHTCSYLQWKLSIDWNPVSIKYQIHKTIIKICTTLHLGKKKGLNEFEYILNSPWTWFKIYLSKKPLWYSPWTKLERSEGNWQTRSVRDWSMSLPPAPLRSLHAEKLVDYFHSSQSQGNRTSRIGNNRGNL